MPDEAHSEKILNSFSPGKLEETTGTSSHNVFEDYSEGPEINRTSA